MSHDEEQALHEHESLYAVAHGVGGMTQGAALDNVSGRPFGPRETALPFESRTRTR